MSTILNTRQNTLPKADMNNDILLQTAAFFSNEPLCETGYWLGACHG